MKPFANIIAALGLFVMVAVAPEAAQGLISGVTVSYPTGTTPLTVAGGDLNGDGWPDLVTANTSDNTVSVLLGDGTGGFGTRTDYPTGFSPSSVAIVDLNGDGRLDLAVSNNSSWTVSVLLGNGGGGFGPKADFDTGASPRWVASGDLNGDGRPDLVTANTSDNTVSVLLGNGFGAFGAKTDYAAGATSGSVAVGDLNGDGHPDLAVGNIGAGTVSILLGDGAGSFGAKTDFTTGAAPSSVAIGDLNHDGRSDLALGNFSSATVSVLLGDGSGGFGAKTDYPTGASPRGVAIGDLNGDGTPDLAVANQGSGTVSYFRGTGAGAFAARLDFATGGGAHSVIIRDLNRDGRLDLAVANTSSTVSVLHVAGPIVGGFAAKTDFVVGTAPAAVALGDLNGDGRPDMVAANRDSDTVSVLLGDGAGGFAAKMDLVVGSGPEYVVIGDVNLDSRPDLVVANRDSDTVSVLLGDGAGLFGAKTDFTTGSGPISVAIGNLNSDGWPDLVVANSISQSVSVLLGTGGGGFGAKIDYLSESYPVSMSMGDLNGDGWPDLVVAHFWDSISIFLGNGAGGFGPRTDIGGDLRLSSVATADLGGDGNLDLVYTHSYLDGFGGYSEVRTRPGDGLGGFGGRTGYSFGVEAAQPQSVTIGDLNGDSLPDLVVALSGYNTVAVKYADGSGGFGQTKSFATGPGPSHLAIADLNGDGLPDLAVANTSSNTISILLRYVPTYTQTALAVNPGTALLGSPMTLTASVIGPGSGAPSTSVSFFDGFTRLGTSAVNGGVAELAVFAPRLGTLELSAVYSGGGIFYGSISATQYPYVATTAAPLVTMIEDIKSDQGLQVRLKFAASAFDYFGSATAIANYHIYRQNTGGALAPPAGSPAPTGAKFAGWDFVSTVPANAAGPYELVVPTLADSNATGIHRAVYLVRAATATPGIFFDSAPDSGYSVDNLAPALPTGFVGNYLAATTELQWSDSTEPDFWYYRVYSGATESFVPDETSLIATSTQVSYVDAGPGGQYYKLSAVDLNGNESPWALLSPDQMSDVPGTLSTELRLYPNRPNPFNPRTTIRFNLPAAGPVRLVVFDVAGRLVRTLVSGDLSVGRHDVDWNGLDSAGRNTPSGTYFAQLVFAGKSATVRMSLVR